MTLGNKIAHYRKSMNITQEALAQQLEVTNQAVSKWESDQCCPDMMLLPRIADIFDVTIDELFDRTPPKKAEFQTVTGLPWPNDNILRVVLYVGHKLLVNGRAKPGFVYKNDLRVDGVISAVSITCGDVSGNVDAGGSVNCGSVLGNVDAGGYVNCGNVEGSVDAGSRVNCGNVGGYVDAGTDVNCGDVGTNVDAGVNVYCGNIEGDVDAGCNVECSSINGDVDAGGSVTVKK